MRTLSVWLVVLSAAVAGPATVAGLERVRVASDGKGFVLAPSGRGFTPWGFNYDHDAAGRPIEDYWEQSWHDVEQDFREMKVLGANVVRVHLLF